MAASGQMRRSSLEGLPRELIGQVMAEMQQPDDVLHAPRCLVAMRIAEEKGAARQPVAIVAETVKGWGAPSLQGGGWHGKPATGERLEQARRELRETRSRLTTALTSTDVFSITPPVEASAPAARRRAR